MKEPTRKEDATNLSLIGGAAIAGLLVTLGFLAGHATSVRYRVVVPEVEVAPVPPAPVVIAEVAPVIEYAVVETPEAPATGDNRLYGRVHTLDGNEYVGYLRWDRNEGSWADLLDATKHRHRHGRHGRRSASRTSGIRFGHVSRIEVTGDDRAQFTLKSGEEMELGSNATDLGSGLRALVVHDQNRGDAEFEWDDLDVVEFMPAPDGATPQESRLYGTLTTRSGLSFTGYVTWDVDEIYSSDVLDGEDDGYDREVPFGSIETIERYSSSGAQVTLKNGESMVLRGTNDVDDSNRGISVSDPGLGQIQVEWHDFESVRFHEAEAHSVYGQYDGGARIQGTVVTEDGAELTGRILWDNDESNTWEMLDGKFQGVDFSVEFGNIATISKTRRGVTVLLKDGRSFDLYDSNDVDDSNGGVFVESDGQMVEVDWRDFAELRLDG